MPAALGVDLRTWRRALHERAETAFGEVRTAEYLAEVLGSLGLRVVRGVGGTGLVASLSRGVSDRAVGIRADMDALPLTERGDPGTSPRTPCPPARAAERLSPQHEAASPAKPPPARRAHLGVDDGSVVVLVITEGAAANPLP